jgi:hypothetical protein
MSEVMCTRIVRAVLLSLCNLRVLCVSVVEEIKEIDPLRHRIRR